MPEITKSEYAVLPAVGNGGIDLTGPEQIRLSEETHEWPAPIRTGPREFFGHIPYPNLRFGEAGQPIDKYYELQAPPTLNGPTMGATTAALSCSAVEGATGYRWKAFDLFLNQVFGEFDTAGTGHTFTGLAPGRQYRFTVRVVTEILGTSIYSLGAAASTVANTMDALIMAKPFDYYWPLEDATGTAITAAKGEANGVYGGGFELDRPTIDINGIRSVRFNEGTLNGYGSIDLPLISMPKDFAIIVIARKTERTADRSFIQLLNTGGDTNSQIRIRTATDTTELGKVSAWWRGNTGAGATSTTNGSGPAVVSTTEFNSLPILDGVTPTPLAFALVSRANGATNVDVKFTVLHGASGIETKTKLVTFHQCWFNKIALAHTLGSTGLPGTLGNKTNLQRVVFAMGVNTPTDEEVTNILNSFRA